MCNKNLYDDRLQYIFPAILFFFFFCSIPRLIVTNVAAVELVFKNTRAAAQQRRANFETKAQDVATIAS